MVNNVIPRSRAVSNKSSSTSTLVALVHSSKTAIVGLHTKEHGISLLILLFFYHYYKFFSQQKKESLAAVPPRVRRQDQMTVKNWHLCCNGTQDMYVLATKRPFIQDHTLRTQRVPMAR